MTIFDDDVDMWEQAWADRLLSGESVDGDHGISGVIAAVRATADGPAPAPNAELAVLLRDGLPSEATAARRVPEQVRAWGSRTVRAAVAGVAASLAMGAGVATAAGGGGAFNYVPEPVKRGVDAAVTAVADVLRSEPETTAPSSPPVQETGSSDGEDAAPTTSKGSVKAPAPVESTAVTSTTQEPVAPTTAPTKPVQTTAPATTEPTQPAPSIPPSALPTPDPSGSPSPSPSGSPSGEPEGRKPLDNSTPTPSPSSEPEPEPTDTASPEPAAGEAPAPSEDGGSAEGAADAPHEQKKDKPGRAELTIERID